MIRQDFCVGRQSTSMVAELRRHHACMGHSTHTGCTAYHMCSHQRCSWCYSCTLSIGGVRAKDGKQGMSPGILS